MKWHRFIWSPHWTLVEHVLAIHSTALLQRAALIPRNGERLRSSVHRLSMAEEQVVLLGHGSGLQCP